MTSQEANSIPLGDILSHYGYEPSRRYGGYDMYRSPFRSDTSPSFKVFREENRWYDFGDGTYGRGLGELNAKKTKIIEQHIQLYLVIVGKFIILYV